MERVIGALFWLLTLLSPMKMVILTMVFLICVDFVTGAFAAYRNKEPISSKRIGNTISKFFIYNLVILASYFLEEHIVKEIPFLKIIAGFIAITEIKSILENFDKIYGVNPFKALVGILKKTYLKGSVEEESPSKKTTK